MTARSKVFTVFTVFFAFDLGMSVFTVFPLREKTLTTVVSVSKPEKTLTTLKIPLLAVIGTPEPRKRRLLL